MGQKRMIWSVIIIIVGVALYMIPCFFRGFAADNLPTIEKVFYASQIVSATFVIVGVVIAAWQYFIVSKSEIAKLETDRVQRAIDLSLYYNDEILTLFVAIKRVYDYSGIIEIMQDVPRKEMVYFDEAEKNDIIKPSQLRELNEIERSNRFVSLIKESNEIYDLHIIMPVTSTSTPEHTYTNNNDNDNDFIISAFKSRMVLRLLNNLEYFSMHFIHHTADDSVVYQSLHQTYLEMVSLLYSAIASQNKIGHEKFYTNVIDLYRIWYETDSENCEKANANSEKIISRGTIVS